MRFLRIKLENWRNFRSVDVNLQRRMFIVGPNASGKSNFLDAFRFLKDVAGLGFTHAVTKRGGVSKIRCLSARRKTDVAIQVELGEASEKPLWTYRLEFSQDNLRRPVIKKEVVYKNGKMIIERPEKKDKRDVELLTQTHLEQVTANKRFREIADFFNIVRYLHIVPHLVREPERSSSTGSDPYGSDFLEQVYKTPARTRVSRLEAIQEALTIAIPQLAELKVERDDSTGRVHLMGRFKHWRPRGAWQKEDQFSDGTLRLLGLLWSLLEKAGTLLLEEPEISLHAEVVKQIPQMFSRISRWRKRQLIVSTHSTDMLSDPGISPKETLLLSISDNGTEVQTAFSNEEVMRLYDAGFTMDEAVVPITSPSGTEQLALFGKA